jgi:prephenate dehydrogenase
VNIKDLDKVSILGLGLLGGSLGLAINRAAPGVKRVGYSHRPITRRKALRSGVIDIVCPTVEQAVRDAQLVILASPIGTFEQLFIDMAPHLPSGCVVTDVGSTKVLPTQWAQKHLPRQVHFLGSHPMAGSEQRGVDYARDDLFNLAPCILTPTAKTPKSVIDFLRQFWTLLQMRVTQLSPAQHDRILARISHLPHLLACALINCCDLNQTLLCGKGFLDTTRIASGPPGIWRDIVVSNADPIDEAIGRMIKELSRMQTAVRRKDDKTILKLLTAAQLKRNKLVTQKMNSKELPA